MNTDVSTPVLATGEFPRWMLAARRPFHQDMYAFYSSVWGGIVTEPLAMTLPIDDHLAHRGDGVFETIKCVQGRMYCFNEHLDRLLYSAHSIGLTPPEGREMIKKRILDTIRVAGKPDHLVRVILGRGPGSMGINPYDCPLSSLYILVHKAAAPFMESHPGGARVITSAIPVKSGIYATIKSCNYLPNALMKKEAVDGGVDFTLTFDENQQLAEGATENFGIVTPGNILVVPPAGRILSGTTMNRAFELADTGIRAGWLTGKQTQHINRDALENASEILIFGTTTNVTSVTELDGRPVSGGRPGPVYAQLSALLFNEQHTDNACTTRAFA